MSILDSLNPINLVKNAADSLVDSVLPDQLKAVGRDVVDAALDVAGGNYAALGNDVGAFLHDAETALGPLTALASGALAAAPATTEPDAPPASTTTAGHPKAAAPGTKAATSTPAAAASPASAGETVATSVPPAPQGAPDATAAVPDGAATVAGSATATASSTDDTSTAKPAAKSTSKSTSTTTSKSSASSDAKDVTKFFAQSDTDLMAAVRDGKLPDAVKDDPAAMQRLQLRMNEISEMNQLISQMLAAMHDMNKAVIQNIRA